MISIFACGGAGVNVAKKYKDGSCNKFFIDTSQSNLKGLDSNNVMVVEDMDGAGKLRHSTYDKFKELVDDVLIRFKPSDELNIVISSLSGGSGSVIAPLIVKKLLEENKNVVVFGIDSKNSVIEINNTVKTLMTYKSISDKINKNVSILYFENANRYEVDQQCMWSIDLFGLLIDKKRTEEFDIGDLHNFLNFDKVTDNHHNVSFIEVEVNDVITPIKDTAVISSILMTKDKNANIQPVIPEYLAVCVVSDKEFVNEDIRINNIIGSLGIKIESLEKTIKDFTDNKKINKVKSFEITGGTEDGMVL